jgi:hypothetical protein
MKEKKSNCRFFAVKTSKEKKRKDEDFEQHELEVDFTCKMPRKSGKIHHQAQFRFDY